MSEFYAQRRTSIKDGIALVAFIAGWFAAAPYGWSYIPRGFDDGCNAARGVFFFLTIVFAAGVIAGALGLVLGDAVGAMWERYHQGRRGPADARYADDEDATPRVGVEATPGADVDGKCVVTEVRDVHRHGGLSRAAATRVERVRPMWGGRHQPWRRR